jgi:hypothetical protein
MECEQWLAIAKCEHFVYRAEVERPWPPVTILELLEGCYREYYEMMGPGLKIWIEVEDRLCPSGKRAARRINGKIVCEFPDGFHNMQLAYHFFAHEVFHHRVGGYTVSHGTAIEALTQYMTNRTLAKLGWRPYDRLMRDRRQRRQQVDAGAGGEMARYRVLFEDLESQKGESTLYELCRELAQCFRELFPTHEKADVAPILRRYLGSVAM